MSALALGGKCGKPGSGGCIRVPASAPTAFLPASKAKASPPRRSPLLPKNCRRVRQTWCLGKGSIAASKKYHFSIAAHGFIQIQEQVGDHRISRQLPFGQSRTRQ